MTDNLPVVHSVGFSFAEMRQLAESIARSQLFGMKTPDQALALMMISQAEGRHPALAARDYHIISGRPAKTAEAMQRDFLAAGGQIKWKKLDDTEAEATFSHPQGGQVTIAWDMQRARKAGINNPMYAKYPRQMLRSRVISEGVRTVFPTATSGMYVPEEAEDMRHEPIDVTPPKAEVVAAQVDQWRAERDGKAPETQFEDVGLDVSRLLAQGNAICHDQDLLKLWWTTHLSPQQRGALGAKGKGVGPYLLGWKEGEKQTEQSSAVSPTTPEQPADDGAGSPSAASPQAENFDAFGLPQSDDEAFCAEMLKKIRQCTTQKDVNDIKLEWSPGALYSEHMERLPKLLWENLMVQIGQHEASLRSAA